MNALRTIRAYWKARPVGFWSLVIVIVLLLRWISFGEAFCLEILILLFCIEDHVHSIRTQLAAKEEKKDTLLLG